MKISCEKCGTSYNIDEARIPAVGLTMKCTRCLHSFNVRPEQAGAIVPPAPAGAIVPPPPAAGGAIVPPAPAAPGAEPREYYVRRGKGTVFGPFPEHTLSSMILEGKLSGHEEVSLDGNEWVNIGTVELGSAPTDVVDLPGLPQQRGQREPIDLPQMPQTEPEVADLPGLPQQRTPEVADLPGLPQQRAPEIADLPGLPQQRAPEIADLPGLPRQRAPEVADLPGLPRQRAPEVADLPGLPLAGGGEPAAPQRAGGSIDLSDFDINTGGVGGPAPDLADLPRPHHATVMGTGSLPGQAPAPMPRPSQPMGTMRGVGLPELPNPTPGGIDLPTPKGESGGSPTVMGYPPPSVIDLPAPKSAAPGPAPDLTDLPTPSFGVADLPAPKGQGQAGTAPPDQHAPPVVDLPMPKSGLGGSGEAPATGMDWGTIELSAGNEPALDFNALDTSGPDDAAPASDGPFPGGTPDGVAGVAVDLPFDLPTPVSGDFNLPSSGADLPTPIDDLQLPMPQRMPLGEADLVAPKPADDDVINFGPDGGVATVDDAAPATAKATAKPTAAKEQKQQKQKKQKQKKQKQKKPRAAPRIGGRRKPLIIAGAAVGVIVLGGVGLGLFTDYGFFGMALISGSPSATAGQSAAHGEALASMRLDSFIGYRQAATALDAPPATPEDFTGRALKAQVIAAQIVRFGPTAANLSDAQQIVGGFPAEPEPTREMKKARALLAIAQGQLNQGISDLTALADQEPADVEASVYLGWAQLQAKRWPPAIQSFNRALAAERGATSALYGLARAQIAIKKAAAATATVERGLKASPLHAGLRLLHGELLLDEAPQQALEAFTAVTKRGKAVAPHELAIAHTHLGQLALKEGKTDVARDHFTKALTADPMALPPRVALGQILFDSGELKSALEQFQAAGRMGDTNAQLMIARTQLAMGKALDARNTLKKLVQSSPRDARIRYLLGLSEKDQNVDGAIAHFKLAIELKPDYFDPYQQLAQIYLAQKKRTDAFAALEQASTALPRSPAVRNAIGEAHLAVGEYDKARTVFEEAIALDKTFNSALFNLANTLLTQSKQPDADSKALLDQAMARYEELKDRDQRFPGLAARLGTLYMEQHRPKEAAEAYAQALQVDNPPLEMQLDACKAFIGAGEYDKVLSRTEQILQVRPTMARARALHAEARLGKGHTGDALAEIRQALARDQTAEFHEIHARVLSALGRGAQAVEAYGEAIKADPSRADLRITRAKVLIREGAAKDGLAEMLRVVKAEPNNAAAYLYIGMAQSDLDQEKKALASFLKALSIDPNLGEAHLRAGNIYFDTQRLPQAQHHFGLATKGATEDDEWRAQAFYRLGAVAHKRGQKRTAVDAWQTFLQIAPAEDASRDIVVKELKNMGVKPKGEGTARTQR